MTGGEVYSFSSLVVDKTPLQDQSNDRKVGSDERAILGDSG